MANCPSCSGSLRVAKEGAVEIDICDACDSIWLDPGELNEIVAPTSCALGDPMIKSHESNDLCCPRCQESDFCDIAFSAIDVSRCNDCGGVFIGAHALDELASIERDRITQSAPDESPDDHSESIGSFVGGTVVETIVHGTLELLVSAIFHI